jgi:nifR3 family TIM-barrel protein
MEGVTDAPFRQIMLQAGKPDVMFTEFTSVDGLFSLGWDHVKQRLEYDDNERPLVAQIWGLIPENFFNAARLLKELQFDGVDINFGCPVKDVIKMGACSAMINNKALAAELIAATKEGLSGEIPLSVKIRIGFDKPQTEAWVGFLLEQGIEALTVHGRTTKELSKVPADWSEIAKAVNVRNQMKSSTVIIGNGDVVSREDALQKSQETGVDGVMIGRGVFQDPYLFQKPNPKSQISNNNNNIIEKRLELLLQHMHLYEAYWEGAKPFANLKKYFKIYCQGFNNAKELRVQLMEASSSSEVERILEAWTEQVREQLI